MVGGYYVYQGNSWTKTRQKFCRVFVYVDNSVVNWYIGERKTGNRFLFEEVMVGFDTEFMNAMVLDMTRFLCDKTYRNACDKGFHSREVTEAETLVAIHSEVTEVWEAIRAKNPESEKIPGFSCVEEEYADVIIHILSNAGHRGYRIGEALLAKIEFNSTRPRLHGKGM